MSAAHSKWVKLNVGGQLFQTTLTSLLSCPNSMLTNMFDPDSGLEPGYSENGVYFLDINPKYFSVILDWLRHKKVLADIDTNLDNVAEVAKFFGLEELVEELKMIGAMVVLSDDGKAAGELMGLYLRKSENTFRQAGGDLFLYQHSNGTWFINDILHQDLGFLKNTAWKESHILPRYGWKCRDKDTRQWVMDEELKVVDASEIKFCNTITMSSTKYSQKEFLGEFRRVPDMWQNGWPVFKNKNGKKLLVPEDENEWYVSDDLAENFTLSSCQLTSCPAHPKPGKYWQYWKDDEDDKNRIGRMIDDETFKVKCDVHG